MITTTLISRMIVQNCQNFHLHPSCPNGPVQKAESCTIQTFVLHLHWDAYNHYEPIYTVRLIYEDNQAHSIQAKS